MKRSTWVLVGLLLVVFASTPAFAQYSPRPWTGRIGMGWTIPTASMDEWVQDGWNFTGGFGYYLPDKPIGFRVDFFWSWHDFTRKAIDEILEHTDSIGYAEARASYVTFDLVMRSKRRGPAQLYLMGGVGAYNRYVEFGDIVGYVNDPWYPWWGYYPIYGSYFSDSDVEFGYNLGGGVDIEVGRGAGSVYVESAFHSTTHDPSPLEFVPIIFGYRW